tara:strand:- start:1819 stop:2808 length:990 start_codon:yes stop_codon:yes gene_type:complete
MCEKNGRICLRHDPELTICASAIQSKAMNRVKHKATVSFLIVGAQKSGTTSLHRYLSAHPEIHMPGAKEIEYFSDDNNFQRGLGWYLNQCAGRAQPGKIIGEASTHYMMIEHVPKRIRDEFPHMKLIMLLRNPIDRAYSHYNMAVRRGVEAAPFQQAIKRLLRRGAPLPTLIDHDREFLMFGEYGRILTNYLAHFESAQIKVIFTEEMEADPAAAIQDLYRFVGASPDFIPNNLATRYHSSGVQRFPGFSRWFRRKATLLKRKRWFNKYFWRIDLDRLAFLIETEINVKKVEAKGPTADIREILRNYYSADVAVLETALGRKVPWGEFR